MYDQATKLREIADQKRECGQDSRVPNRGDEKLFSMPVRTIAITSGKGGVGKTNIAANLGLAIAAQNKRVGIIDADLGLANIDVILKLKPRYDIGHVIAGKKSLKDIFITGPAGLTIIPAGSGRFSLANLPRANRDRLIRELAESVSDFDIMFIDTAAGISNNVIDFAMLAQEVFVITTPEPTSITDAYAMIKVISQLRLARNTERFPGLNDGLYTQSMEKLEQKNNILESEPSIGIIVNMVENSSQAMEVAERIITAARQFTNAEAHFVGHILTDVSVSNAVFAQQPLIFKYPESSAAKCINTLADKILGHE